MICNLTNMDIANCSLLDESSACAEAMISLYNYVNKKHKNTVILIDSNCFKQHISVLKTRANSLNIEYDIFDIQNAIKNNKPLLENSIAIFHMQNKMGELIDLKYTLNYLKNHNIKSVVVMDPLASTIYEPPGSYDADIVVGSTQRFGLPMWNGGPHAAFFAAKQKYTRYIPGRIVGKSIDTENNPGYRLALQTREQHIKKDKAFSNICTSQALLANYNVLYAMYLGPRELQKRALTIKNKTILLRELLKKHLDTRYYNIINENSFDTITIQLSNYNSKFKEQLAIDNNILINFDHYNKTIGITLDETTTLEDIQTLLKNFFFIFSLDPEELEDKYNSINDDITNDIYNNITRITPLLPQKIFEAIGVATNRQHPYASNLYTHACFYEL